MKDSCLTSLAPLAFGGGGEGSGYSPPARAALWPDVRRARPLVLKNSSKLRNREPTARSWPELFFACEFVRFVAITTNRRDFTLALRVNCGNGSQLF